MDTIWAIFWWIVLINGLAGLGLYLVHVPFNHVRDAYISILTLAWLIGITKVPWSIYFKSLETKDKIEAKFLDGIENDKAKAPKPEDKRFVHRLNRFSIAIALFLHVVTTAGMAALAVFNIWPLGMYAAVVSCLFTFVRPLDYFYNYCRSRLNAISKGL